MLLTATLLAVLPAVVLSGQNTPSGWTCSPLNVVKASHEDCVASATYDGATWSVNTKKVGTDINRFCVVTLSGVGIKENQDFYVKGTFTTTEPIGPFGGISFNMEDTDNGNYVMMRLKNPSTSNVEIGRLVNKIKSPTEAKTAGTPNAAVTRGSATLEILVNEGKESVFIDGVKEPTISAYQPFYVEPGAVGFAFQNAKDWGLKITGAEVCSYCVGDNGQSYLVGESYQDGLQTCTCKASGGMECKCGATLQCGGGTTLWTDPDTCESKCIKDPAYCVSSGDPHYRTFDGKSYDFHGQCTYQAASCGDFVVNFKNVDLIGRAPRYTRRIELEFKGSVFSIEAGNQAAVDGVPVQVPYEKHYNNGDKVEIINNGQLEIRLYNKGRDPSVRLRATNYNRWINAEMWLHGSCADITEGICGNWNGNAGDEFGDSGNINTNGENFKKFDENCPPPPEPWDPCKDIHPTARADALQMCAIMKDDPFKQCNGVVDVGNEKEGIWYQCATDVCNCFIDQNCACAQLDVYAQTCINNGIDLANWRESVEFCPYNCPEGQTYNSRGPTPVPTCLDKDPEPTGTVRGCFCPEGQFLQDGVCVNGNQCKCLYEGVFYNNGQKITKDAECEECTCQDAGEMTCGPLTCPTLNCASDELEATEDDECCARCLSGWVEALNPEVTVKKDQTIQLTCEVKVDGVMKDDIKWYKGDEEITKGISKDKLVLKVTKADADDDGTYTCKATKDGVTASDDFDVTVVMPKVCEHEDGTTWEEGTVYKPQETVECTCDQLGEHVCECADDGEECTDPNPVAWFNDECVKTCVPDFGLCTAAADPFYVTFDGTEFEFKGDCKYNFFNCDEIKMYADHEKDNASAKTKSIEIAFKNDVFKFEANKVTINGNPITVPMHKTYGDGATLTMEDLGTEYTFTIVQDGKDPLVHFKWDKVSSYSVEAHGTCKGFTGGMCGSWDDKKKNDFTDADGNVLDNAEDFGKSWAQDDETDCPDPPEPENQCKLFGLETEQSDYEDYVNSVLTAKPFKKCGDSIDLETFAYNMVQQICGCGGDLVCACPLFNQLAEECEQAGVKADGWQNKNDKHKCIPKCPEGATFQENSPKPAPSCENPEGGKKSQAACVCPKGQVLVDEECIDVSECGCEYGGELFQIGDKFEKPEECLSCKCTGEGEDCEDIKCKKTCKDDELEVDVEGECCPQCLADWVEAVNPEAVADKGESLELTCAVEGVEVTAENVRWIREPGNEDITDVTRPYTVSEDGLTLTIKKMDAKRVGTYKCVVEKDGKSSEGVFDVSLPPVEEDLVEAVEESVEFTAGESVTAECTLLQSVNEVTWTCNGKKMENKGNVKIVQKKSFTRIVFNPAEADDAGTCTCSAKGVGTEDSADIELIGQVDEDLVEAVEESVEFTAGKSITAECTLLQSVNEVTWTCNGKKMENKGNVKIVQKKSFTRIVFNPAEADDAGTCTCSAKGDGTEDSADIELIGQENEIKIVPVEDEVECMEKSKSSCVIAWTIETTNGKTISNKKVKICKFNNGKTTKCKKSKLKNGNYQRKFGKRRKMSHAGQYVAEVDVDGEKIISDPITLNITENPDKKKDKGDKKDKKDKKNKD